MNEKQAKEEIVKAMKQWELMAYRGTTSKFYDVENMDLVGKTQVVNEEISRVIANLYTTYKGKIKVELDYDYASGRIHIKVRE